jgi:hypothetical protein
VGHHKIIGKLATVLVMSTIYPHGATATVNYRVEMRSHLVVTLALAKIIQLVLFGKHCIQGLYPAAKKVVQQLHAPADTNDWLLGIQRLLDPRDLLAVPLLIYADICAATQ